MLQVKTSEKFGRGVYSTKLILQGQWIEICEILELDIKDSILVSNTALKNYTFKLDLNRDCLVLGHGELYNHSDTPNVSYRLLNLDGRAMMVFKALRTIQPDEQLFTDYRQDDPKIDLTQYFGGN